MPIYMLVTDGPYTDDFGNVVPVGSKINSIIWDGESAFTLPTNVQAMPDDGRAMWLPPPPIPQSIEMWQLKVALLAIPSKIGGTGTALDDANALATKTGGAAAITWANASTVALSSPLLNSMAPAIGFQPADVKALFTSAAAISV